MDKVLKILLIKSPEIEFGNVNKPVEKQSYSVILIPMGILNLGTYVKAKMPNINVEYLDLDLEANDIINHTKTISSPRDFIQQSLIEKMKTNTPEIIGLSCCMNTFADSFHLCSTIINELVPDALLVAGGHYPSSYTKKVAEDTNVDYVIVGEGELPFTDLIEKFRQRSLPDDKEINTGKYLKDFTSFPQLDYEGIDLERYLQHSIGMMKDSQSISLLTSRGCPNKCIYCGTHNVWDYGFRPRMAKQMVEEIEYLKNQFGVKEFIFIEDNFAINKQRVKQFCRILIERDTKIYWSPSSIQVNCLDEEMVELMAKSGCQMLNLAVETGSPRIQKLIRKNVRLDHAIKMSEVIVKSGINCECLLIFGFPGETIEEMKETVQFAKKLKCRWYQMGIATPLYGTEMYEICERNGWLPDTTNKTHVFREGTFSTSDFTKEQVEEFMWDANYRLNFLENQSYLLGDFDSALFYFEGLAQRYPEHFICKFMMFQIYLKQKKEKYIIEMANDLKMIYNRNEDQIKGLITKYCIDFDKVIEVSSKINLD